MSQVSSTSNSPANSQPFGAANALNNLDLDSFLDLMIAELQNQDPLNPLENDQLLAQISQIREIGATDRLSQTLDSVLAGSSSASYCSLPFISSTFEVFQRRTDVTPAQARSAAGNVKGRQRLASPSCSPFFALLLF